MKKQTKPGKPGGELEVLLQMENQWSKVKNTLLEDASGQLWLASLEHRMQLTPELIEATNFKPVDVVTALTWIKNVSEFADGFDGDIADVCRIALAELARRPTDLERVHRAIQEERRAGWKPRRSRAAKS